MKKLILVAAIIIAALQTYAQSDPLREKLDSIFEHIDKGQIPTGYLKEYGSEMTPLHRFNGEITDSNLVEDLDTWRGIYADIWTAKIQTDLPEMASLSDVNNLIDDLREADNAPVALFFAKYAKLRDDALEQNLMMVENEQIFDVPERRESPYTTEVAFAAASINRVFTNTVAFTYKPELFFANTDAAVRELFVDFGDGSGLQPIPEGSTLSFTYTDSSGTKVIFFQLHLQTGEILNCTSSVFVYVTGAAARYQGSDPYAREIPVPVVAGEGLGGDVMQIRYSQRNPTRTTGSPHLRKPLIYVEGYDVSGQYNILSLVRDDPNEESRGEWVRLATEYDFMYNLDDVAGYDLVFVNYNTMRSFEDNTKMLQHVIEWVKQDKTAGGSTEPNVMIGVSAGGVLARYTLARMTKALGRQSTDTRLLITHDSPHQGANVPLAFQHFLYDLGNVSVFGIKIKDKKEDLRKFFELNTKAATAQLLKARVVDEHGTVVMNTFLNGPNNPYQQMVTFTLTDNQPMYRFIATAQGSQCGIPVMPANNLPLANCDGEFAILRFVLPTMLASRYYLKTQLNALPGSGTQAMIEYFRYSRRISLWGIGFGTRTLKEETRTNPAGFTDWDAAPGSTQSIKDRTGGALTAGQQNETPWYAYIFMNVRAGLNLNITQDLFSFVSTLSALDAPAGTPLNQPYIFSNTGTNGTATQKYIAQEQFTLDNISFYNRNHTDYRPRNAQWMYNEMENITHTLDCTAECVPLTSEIQLFAGSEPVCSSATYSITNLPVGVQVQWGSAPQGAVTFQSPNSSQTLVTPNNHGVFTLIATITFNCGADPVILYRSSIDAGIPYIALSSYTNMSLCDGDNYFQVQQSPAPFIPPYGGTITVLGIGGSTITWSEVSSSDPYWTWSALGNTVTVGGRSSFSTLILRAAITNNCGSFTKDYYFSTGHCLMAPVERPASETETVKLSVSPNPATSTLTVTLSATKGSNFIEEVIVKDKFANEVLRQKFSGQNKSEQINIQSLPTDVYVVQVFDGRQWLATKIIKQ